MLDAPDLDLAVARGAAYYGLARARPRRPHPRRRGAQLLHRHRDRDAGGARLRRAAKALCVVPFGMEEGQRARAIAGREFGLVGRRAGGVPLPRSTIRKNDPPGALVEDWGDELEELGPLEVTLDRRRSARRTTRRAGALESRVTEVGTLELWCVAPTARPPLEARVEHP